MVINSVNDFEKKRQQNVGHHAGKRNYTFFHIRDDRGSNMVFVKLKLITTYYVSEKRAIGKFVFRNLCKETDETK